MPSRGRFEKVLSVLLVVAIGSAGLPALADPSPALISGSIIRSGTGDPVPGAVVKLAHHPDGKIYESAASDPSGGYAIADLPSGTYDLAVEVDGGLFPVSAPVSLAAGEKRKASFSLQALQEPPPEPPPGEGTPQPETPPEPKPEEPKPAEPQAQEPKKEEEAAVPWYRSWWFGTTVVVGSALILGGLLSSSDDDEPATASPSSD